MQYTSHEKRISALSLIINNVVQNVNLIIALYSALCGSILALTLCSLSIVEVSILAVIVLTLTNIDVKIKPFVLSSLSLAMLYKC